jgi:pyruvate formate lyase activating enzyme
MTLTRAGLVKTTLIDFPGEVAATVFTPGCNLRCPYCHNPELVIPPFPEDLLPIEDVRLFLTKRASVLGGVCITGGEPLLHTDIAGFIDFCKNLGLKVKLDTNGCFPRRLRPLLAGIDYVAMDIKTVPEKYDLLGSSVPPASAAVDTVENALRQSIEIIISSGVRHEFRTTMAPGIAGTEDAIKIAELLKSVYTAAAVDPRRTGRYILTQFRPGTTLDPAFSELCPYFETELHHTAETIRETGMSCEVRGI